MTYVGIHTQQVRNNFKSMLLLILFPCIILAIVYAFLAFMNVQEVYDGYGGTSLAFNAMATNEAFLYTIPWVVGIVGIWFMISYFSNASMVRSATGAKPLERRENPRIYNIVENLTMTCGMPMPKINIIDDPQLNAFASGIDEKSYTVTVTTGICNRFIISIIFVGIMSTALSLAVRMLWNTFIYGGGNRRTSRDGKNGGSVIAVILVAIVLAAIGYFFTLLTRFAISRKREYMADAGGAELCGNPLALASALRKISSDPGLGQVDREDVAQLFIVKPLAFKSEFTNMMSKLFSTHPSIESRIAYLEQF